MSQWKNPNDVLSILLIVGVDVIQKALAQLSGGHFVLVAFNSSWVGHSFGALMSAAGGGQLMPSMPDVPSMFLNTEAGYSRTNISWILGRFCETSSNGSLMGIIVCVSPSSEQRPTQVLPHTTGHGTAAW